MDAGRDSEAKRKSVSPLPRRRTTSPVPPADAAGAGAGPAAGAYDKVITAVRARPLNAHDGAHATDIVRFSGDEKRGLGIVDPSNPDGERVFQFDHTFWSVDPTKTEYFAGQDKIFEAIGMPILETCLKGVNCSLFAYGQTGSGKTYTMMGGEASSEDAGVIPRLCRQLLETLYPEGGAAAAAHRRTSSAPGGEVVRKTDVRLSYLEIYNEKAFDLLSASPGVACRVREHPETGAYVESLTKAPVTVYADVERVLREGGNRRHVAATLMNSESSRSHAVFTLFVTQHLQAEGANSSEDVVRKSKVSLVDLAGSERLSATGASGDRLREASNINRSLSVLGDVIKALSEKSRLGSGSRSDFVPYRNSILTWLLKDSLGGNSRTTMLATVSPTDSSYSESINTLRYIERTKLILNNVSVNVNRSENARVNGLLKQISELEVKYAELQSHQMSREQQHRDDIEQMQAEFEAQFTEQLKVLAGDLEKHYARQAHAQMMQAGFGRGMSFQEATCFDGPDDGGGGAPSPGAALSLSSPGGAPPPPGDWAAEKERLVEKYEAIIKGKDATIASYEKVLSTGKEDEDATLTSLKTMIATLKEQLDAANSRYDTLAERYREFDAAVEQERREMAEVSAGSQQLAAELTKLRLDGARRDRELADRGKELEGLRAEADRWRAQHADTAAEHATQVANLEECIQEIAAQDRKGEEEVPLLLLLLLLPLLLPLLLLLLLLLLPPLISQLLPPLLLLLLLTTSTPTSPTPTPPLHMSPSPGGGPGEPAGHRAVRQQPEDGHAAGPQRAAGAGAVLGQGPRERAVAGGGPAAAAAGGAVARLRGAAAGAAARAGGAAGGERHPGRGQRQEHAHAAGGDGHDARRPGGGHH
jgi:hypothetical protein